MSHSKSHNIINISSGHYNVNLRMRSSGETNTKILKQNVFSRFHTSHPYHYQYQILYCRLLTIQYSQPCSCAYSRSNM